MSRSRVGECVENCLDTSRSKSFLIKVENLRETYCSLSFGRQVAAKRRLGAVSRHLREAINDSRVSFIPVMFSAPLSLSSFLIDFLSIFVHLFLRVEPNTLLLARFSSTSSLLIDFLTISVHLLCIKSHASHSYTYSLT